MTIDYNEIWTALGSFWQNAENKEIIEELWGGLAISYEYLQVAVDLIKNAYAGFDMAEKIYIDHYPLEVLAMPEGVAPGTADAGIDLGVIMDIGHINYRPSDTSYAGKIRYDKDTDYTIIDTKLQFTNSDTYLYSRPEDAIVVCEGVYLDATKFLYEVYKNIFSYYPINYDATNRFTPAQYVYSLKPMLYTWRYGYTVNNLQTSVNSIIGMPYTNMGGTVISIDNVDQKVYMFNDAYKRPESIDMNGYAVTVKEGDTLRPMTLLASPQYIVDKLDSGAPQSVLDVEKTTTIRIHGADTLTDVQQNFLINFMDAIVPKKYSYYLDWVSIGMEEENIVVG